MFDDRTIMGLPSAVVVLAVAVTALAVGLGWLWRVLPSAPDPQSFRATESRPAGSSFARTARLGLGLALAVAAAQAAFAISPVNCLAASRLGDPASIWPYVILGAPQLVVVPGLVFAAGGWTALGDPEVRWRWIGLGLALGAALATLLIAVALAPACP